MSQHTKTVDNHGASRYDVTTAWEMETDQDTGEEYDEQSLGFEIEVGMTPAKPKARRPRPTKDSGRPKAAKKFKRVEDVDDSEVTPLPAKWSPASEAAFLRYALASIAQRGSINAEIVTANLIADGFAYSKTQVLNKLGNFRIDGKTIHQYLGTHGPPKPPPPSRPAILEEVEAKIMERTREQAAFEAVHSPSPIGPAVAPHLPTQDPLQVTIADGDCGMLDCLWYVWKHGYLALVAHVGADDIVTFETIPGPTPGAKVSIWKNYHDIMGALVRSDVSWLRTTFSDPHVLLDLTSPTPPQVFKVYVPELPHVPQPAEIVTVDVNRGRKIVAARIDLPTPLSS